MKSTFLQRLLMGVAGLSSIASAQVTRMVVETSVDGSTWSGGTRAVPAGSTLQFRYVVTFDPSGTTAAPIGFAALTFQPTVSGWSASETLAPFAATGNNLNGGSVAESSGLFGRITPFAATGPTTTDPYRGHTQSVGGVNYVRLARTTITNWIGVGPTSGTSAANNFNGAGGIVCVQKGVNALNTSDPAFNGSISGVVLARFGMTLSGDTSERTLVFDAPTAGMSRNATTGVREASWYSSAADLVGTIKGAVSVTPAQVIICQPPVLTGQPASTAACVGAPATFTVAATNATGFQWRKGGVDIAGATSATLSLPAVSAADAGSYDCVVTNGCITVTSSSASLTVNTVPGITSQPVSTAACAGSNASFTVGATGATSLQWRRNGANIAGATAATLSLNAVAAASAGVYDCVLTNVCGSVTTATATLTVNTAPVIDSGPANAENCLGGEVSFSVSSSNAVSAQWRRNGVDIPGATSTTFSIRSVTDSDAGSYVCVLTNQCGSTVSAAATLVVRTPVAITTQPSTVSACTGQPASLTVAASGTGPITFAWRKNGSFIPGATSATLSFASLSAGDNGSYDCAVSGPCGTVISAAVAINVGTAPVIDTQPSNADACEGQPVSLTVAASGTAPLTFQWKRSGVDVAGATSSTLSIPALASGDAGSYTCTVTNGCSSTTSNAATVSVRARVAFTLQPQSATVCVSSPISFSVAATGAGPLTFQWKRNGTNISGATSASLTFAAATTSLAGTFTCEVTGACGSLLSAPAILTVQSPLTWAQQPTSVSAAVGQSVTLTVQATGSGSIAYQWRKNGINIQGATSPTLVFNSLVPSDSGNYFCNATSSCGLIVSNGAQVLAISSGPSVTGRCTPEQLLDPAGSANDGFGSVAASGDVIVVGASRDTIGANAQQGSASIFRRAPAGVTHEYHLVASDGIASDGFGNAVAADGDTVVVAASNARVSGNNGRGAVYVFVRTGSIWTQQAKLVASDGAAVDAFGSSVAIDGDTVVVGASGDDLSVADAGSAYVFTRSGASWTQRQKLTASDPAANAAFGLAVAISGDDLIVGAPSALVGGIRRGAAYGFARSGNAWTQQVKFVDPAGALDDRFGFSVATAGGRFLVGAPTDDVGSNADQGSVCSFVGWSGACVKIVDALGSDGDFYGVALAIRGDDFVVGVSRDDLSASVANSGGACVHTFSSAGGDAIQVARLVAPGAAAGDLAGESVAFHGDQIVMGVKSDDVGAAADRGSAWVFNLCPGAWEVYLAGDQQLAIDSAADGQGQGGDFAGSSVAVDGDLMAVGVPGDGVIGQFNRGSVRVLVRDRGQWVHRATLQSPTPAADGRFGAAVSVSGQRVAVGAPGDNGGRGAAYLFAASGTSFVLEHTFVASDAASGDAFGSAVSFKDAQGIVSMVIGAPGVDVSDNIDQGAAYAFSRIGATWSAANRLLDPAGSAGDRLGSSVAASITAADDWENPIRSVAIGSPFADGPAGVDQGSVITYISNGDVPDAWFGMRRVSPPDAAAGDAFGSSVSLDRGVLAVGVPFDDVAGRVDQGSVVVFLGGEEWYFRQKVTSSTGAAGDRLGASVSVADGLLAAGSPGDDVGIAADAGSIAHFARVGTTWPQQGTLLATDVISGARLGSAVAAAQGRVLGGASGQASIFSVVDVGAAYFFDAPSQCVAQSSNETTGVAGASLAASVLAARSGDTLTVSPAAFAAASTVDTVGKSLAMLSTGHVRTTSSSVLTLGGASSLMALDGAGVEINGRLLTSSGATGYIAGDRFSLGGRGSLTARLNSSLMVDSSSAELLGAFRVESNGSALFTAPNVTSTGSMRVDQGASLAFDGSLAFASTFSAATDSMVSAQGAIDVHGTMSVINAQISSSLLFNRDILELSGAVSVYGPTVNLDDMRVFGSSALFGDFTNELGALTTIRSGTLFLFGSLTNNGTILGTLCDNCTGLPPGMDVGGDLILGSEATFILPFQGSTVNLGGSFDCAIDSNERFDLSLATVQLEGRGGEQTLEAMSIDIGSLESGLDRSSAGQYPIGTLRIGPTPSVVRLVDARDNDGFGQEFSCEAIYVDTLEILPGSRLINDGCIKIYYRTLVLEGVVDNPDNIVVYAPPCFSDFNRDGGVDFLDIETFFGAWEVGDSSADVNLDGGIDGNDLELFIAQWENGC